MQRTEPVPAAGVQPSTASSSRSPHFRRERPRTVNALRYLPYNRHSALYAFRTSQTIGTGAFTTPDKLVRVAW